MYSQYQSYGVGLGGSTPFVLGFQTPNFLPQNIGLNQKQFDGAVETAVKTGNDKWKTILDNVLEYGGKALTLLVQSGVIKSNNDLYTGNFNQSGLSQYSSSLGTIQEPVQSSFLGLNQNSILLIGIGLLLFFGLGNKTKKSK